MSCAASPREVPFLAFHGGNDTTISYEGGERKNACLPAIPHFIQQWAFRDRLGYHNATTPLAPNTVSYKYGSGFNFGLVELVFDSVIGHDWPSIAPNADNQEPGHHVASFNATPIILDFFKQHPLNFWD
jgi:poly(3-hydroxybutyrate) depolymerase